MLSIESLPDGARVFLDRRFVGSTPVELPDVVAGSHVVRVEAEAHAPWSAAVRVVADEHTRVTAQLSPAANR